MPNHPLFGQDGTVNSSAGAMLPAFASGMQPATVAVTTQQAAGPMHSNFPRHPMAMAHSVSGNQMMSQGKSLCHGWPGVYLSMFVLEHLQFVARFCCAPALAWHW